MARLFFCTLSFCLFFTSFVCGEESEPYIAGRELAFDRIDGIVISGDTMYPPEYIIKTTKGVLFYRTKAPKRFSARENFIAKMEGDLLGKPVTLSEVERCKKLIEDFYSKNLNMHVHVESMERDVGSSVMVLKVVESKVGEIKVKGNKWLSKDYYLKHFAQMTSDAVDDAKFAEDMLAMNKNTWSKAEVFYKDGEGGRTDVELVVQDKNPLFLYGGGDNSGVEATGYGRMFLGVDAGNLFHSDQSLSVYYEASPDLTSYNAFEMDYTLPLSKSGGLDLFTNYSTVLVDNESGVMDGHSFELLARYDLYLPQSVKQQQSLLAGLDYKTTNSDLLTGIMLVSPRFATVAALSVEYNGSFTYKNHQLEVNAGAKGQGWRLLPSMSQRAYGLLRDGADPVFALMRGGLEYSYIKRRAPSIFVKAKGQFSTSTLLPMEQIGLGGIDSVRGYLNHAYNADSGASLSLNVKTPSLSLLRYVAGKYRRLDKLYGTLFLDVAAGWNHRTSSAQHSSRILAGVGPGIEYEISKYFVAKFDLGVRVAPAIEESSDRLIQTYFSLKGTY